MTTNALVHKVAHRVRLSTFQFFLLICVSIRGNAADPCNQYTQSTVIRQIQNITPIIFDQTPFWELHLQRFDPESKSSAADANFWAESLKYNSGGDFSSTTTKYTPLIVAVTTGNLKTVKWLLNFGNKIDINFPDSSGMTALMHAARLNDIKMIKLLLNPSYDFARDKVPWNPIQTVKRTSNKIPKISLNLNAVDNNGWSVIHHLVSPFCSNLAYTRADIILKILVDSGAQVDIRDSTLLLETPLQLALRHRKFSLARSIAKAMKSPTALKEVEKRITDVGEFELFPSIKNYVQNIPIEVVEKDSKKMLDKLKLKLKSSIEPNVIEPDSFSDLTAENSKILIDENRQVPFDCLLNQADGTIGLYKFFKMQLIKQTKGRKLIMRFTRWGKMGETGRLQKIFYSTEEEAIKEFKKIFKHKTGNGWDELGDGESTFKIRPKKFKLVNVKQLKLKRDSNSQEIVKMDFEDLQKAAAEKQSQLPESLFDLMIELCKEHKSKQIFKNKSKSVLPFGEIQHQTIQKADKILDEIEKLLNERNAGNNKDPDRIAESILKVTEEYYTLIPIHGLAFEKIRPFTRFRDLRRQKQLVRNLLHNEFAFELLLAGQLNQEKMNPFDYIYGSLGTKLEAVEESTEEHQLILKYIKNTASNENQPIIEKIYRVEIPGADAKMNELEYGNRQLLWHGTFAPNLLSILHHGLQIAPLGYTFKSESLFGKGIYFGDMFEKAVKYCDPIGPRTSRFIFLCEVALGRIQDVECESWMMHEENLLQSGNHKSRYMPDPSADVNWKGRKIPLGQRCENVLEDKQKYGLDFNEYVVFKPEQANIKYLIQFR